MKFGKIVQNQTLAEFKGEYINYKQQNDLIKKSSMAFHHDKQHLYDGGIRYHPGDDPIAYPHGSLIPPRLVKDEGESDDEMGGDDLMWSFGQPWHSSTYVSGSHNEAHKPLKDGSSDSGSNYGSTDNADIALTVADDISSILTKSSSKGGKKDKKKKKLKKREAELSQQYSLSSPKSKNGTEYVSTEASHENSLITSNNNIPNLPPLPNANHNTSNINQNIQNVEELQLNVNAAKVGDMSTPASVPPLQGDLHTSYGLDGESPIGGGNILQKFKRTLSLQNITSLLSPMEGEKSPNSNPHVYEQQQVQFWHVLNTSLENVQKQYNTNLAKLQVDLQKYLQHGGQVAKQHRFSAESKILGSDSPMVHNIISATDGEQAAPPDQTWYAEVLGAYRRVCRLRRYAQLNYLIVERQLSKYLKFQPKVGLEHAPAPINKQKIVAQRKKVNKLDWVRMSDLESLRERISRSGMLSVTDMGCLEAETAESKKIVESSFLAIVKWKYLFLALLVFFAVLVLPLDLLHHKEGLTDEAWKHTNWQAQKGLAVLLYAVVMWCCEVLPYYATGLTLPPIIAILGVLQDHTTGQVVLPKRAAELQATKMFSSTTCLQLLGYTLATVACSAQLEKRISGYLYTRLGAQPQYFQLAIMTLSWFLSTWLNNHTGPVLTVSVVTPLLTDLGSDNAFVRVLLLGIALGSNLGGMASPLASLQNIMAVQALQSVTPVSFLTWLLFCGGLSFLQLILAWLLLCRDVDWHTITLPSQATRKNKFTPSQRIAVGSCLIAVALLATASQTELIIGGLIPISLGYMGFVFGTGILKTSQLHSFPWPLILLVSSASTLSMAIESCKLLDILANTATTTLSSNTYIMCIQLLFIVTILSSCVSHTVAALVLTPLMAQIALPLGLSTRIIIGTALCINAAMPQPFSSFPNLHSLALKDETGNSYLKPKDIMKIGSILTIVSFLVIISIALPGIKYFIE